MYMSLRVYMSLCGCTCHYICVGVHVIVCVLVIVWACNLYSVCTCHYVYVHVSLGGYTLSLCGCTRRWVDVYLPLLASIVVRVNMYIIVRVYMSWKDIIFLPAYMYQVKIL